MNSTFKTVILWVTLVAVAVVLWRMIQGGPNAGKDQEIAYTQFMSELNSGNVVDVTIEGNVARGKLRNGSMYHSVVPASNPALLKSLDDHKDVTGCAVVCHDPTNANGRQQGIEFWQEPGAAALHAAEEDHV